MKAAMIGMMMVCLGTVMGSGDALATQVDLYLLGGQSNMDGRALSQDLPAALQTAEAAIPVYVNGGWQNLQPGLNYDRNSAWFGPEVTFGRDIAAATGRNVALVKYAVGSTTLADEWHAPDANGQGAGLCYTGFMTSVNAARASFGPDVQVTIRGMVWMQGETDAWYQDPARANAYEQNLTAFIASVRSDLKVADLPFIIGRISPSWNWSGGGHGAIVRQAQYDVSQTVANTLMINTDDLELNPDLAHYSTSGQLLLGSRFAEAMVAIPEPTTLGILGLGGGFILGQRKRRHAE